jgi:uncharacterized membrane protein
MLLGLLTENQTVMAMIANVSFSLEILAVFIITASIIFAIYRYLVGLFRHQQVEICISDFKHAVGRGVQVALELLIAADIINTVVLDATISNVLVLGLLVIIRTFLSWTLMLETEGHLPWWKNQPEK